MDDDSYNLLNRVAPPPGRQAARSPAEQDPAYDYLNKFIVVEITNTIRDIAQEVKLAVGHAFGWTDLVETRRLPAIYRPPAAT